VDGEHLSEMLALIAVFRHGATLLARKDGTTLSGVWMTRGDLRHAVTVLRAIGIDAIAPRPAREARELTNRPASVALAGF
jgi:hypothetical protein